MKQGNSKSISDCFVSSSVYQLHKNMHHKIFGGILLATLLVLPNLTLAGAIADAPPLTTGLTKILDFLLLVFGAIAILGMLVAGIIYVAAGGDERRVLLAKRAFSTGLMGVVIALGSMVLVWTIARLLAN